MRKRSVEIAGHRTSVSIEQPFWDALKDLADRGGLSVNELITRIDGARGNNLSSAIRVYVLREFRKAGGA
ncbi:MAG: aryl-sulfate sulfotransferase [Rhodospirillaceae bacterium]|nr:MAG: aryl-sulfate sulfotransferase [Rhodospirillaceae bacterium]